MRRFITPLFVLLATASLSGMSACDSSETCSDSFEAPAEVDFRGADQCFNMAGYYQGSCGETPIEIWVDQAMGSCNVAISIRYAKGRLTQYKAFPGFQKPMRSELKVEGENEKFRSRLDTMWGIAADGPFEGQVGLYMDELREQDGDDIHYVGWAHKTPKGVALTGPITCDGEWVPGG